MGDKIQSKPSIGDELYSGTATFGRIWAVISAVIGTFLAIALIVAGIYIIIHRNHLLSVDGIITIDSKCQDIHTGQDVNTSCSTWVKYKIGDTKYGYSTEKGKPDPGIEVKTGSKSYSKDTKVTVYYDPSTPGKPELSPASTGVGWMIIIIGIIMGIGVWVWVYLTRKYKSVAAVGGAIEMVNLIRR